MTKALFVVSEEGYWGEECVEPLETLSSADVDVQVATPSGSKPVIDETSIDPEQVGEETAKRVREVHENDERLQNAVPVASVEPSEYDTVVYPGGHGTEWDVNQDKHARSILRETIEGDGKALVLCHAVAILAFTRGDDGRALAEGRDITGFPTEWEEEIVDENDCMPDGRKLPYWIEEEIVAAGGNWDPELDADESVTVDGDLVTARGPESSSAGANVLLEEMGLARSAD